MNAPRLRVGLAGAGMVSAFHLPGWRALADEVELVAIADPNMEQARQRAAAFSIPRVYPSLDDMLASERLNAVDLMTPPHLHPVHCHASAQAGVAILCQKPLAPHWREAAEVAKDIGQRVRFMIHENWRFRPHYRQIQRWIADGVIGTFQSGSICVRSSGLLPDASGGRPAIVRQPLLATLPRLIVAEVLVHHLDLAAWLLGAERVVSSELRRDVPEIVGESAATIRLTCAGGTEVEVSGDMADASQGPMLRDSVSLAGDSGRIQLYGNCLSVTGRRSESIDVDFAADYQASYSAAIRHFVQALRNDEPFETPPEWHLQVLSMAEAAYQQGATTT